MRHEMIEKIKLLENITCMILFDDLSEETIDTLDVVIQFIEDMPVVYFEGWPDGRIIK